MTTQKKDKGDSLIAAACVVIVNAQAFMACFALFPTWAAIPASGLVIWVMFSMVIWCLRKGGWDKAYAMWRAERRAVAAAISTPCQCKHWWGIHKWPFGCLECWCLWPWKKHTSRR